MATGKILNNTGMLQIPLFKDLICYVCGRPIQKNDSISIGGGLKRHIKCKPGSRRWQKQQARWSPKRPDEKIEIEEGRLPTVEDAYFTT